MAGNQFKMHSLQEKLPCLALSNLTGNTTKTESEYKTNADPSARFASTN
jgi:hypothetical protein